MAIIRARYPQCGHGDRTSGRLESQPAGSKTSAAAAINCCGITSPPERAELAEAVLLGSRDELDPHRIDDFVETGTIHIVVVAGLHVGILAYLLFKALAIRSGARGCRPWRRWSSSRDFMPGHRCRAAGAAGDGRRLDRLRLDVARARRTGIEFARVGGMRSWRSTRRNCFAREHSFRFSRSPGSSRSNRFGTASRRSIRLQRLIAETRPWHVRILHRAEHELRTVALLGLTIWLVVSRSSWRGFILSRRRRLARQSAAHAAGDVGDGLRFRPACSSAGSCRRWARFSAGYAMALGPAGMVDLDDGFDPGQSFLGARAARLVAGRVLSRTGGLALGCRRALRRFAGGGCCFAAWCGIGFGVAWLAGRAERTA